MTARIRDIRESSELVRRTDASIDTITVTRLLEDWHGAAVSDAAQIIRGTGLDGAPFARAKASSDADLVDALGRIQGYAELIEQTRSVERHSTVKVRSEPRTYGPGSEESFYMDHFWRCQPGHPAHTAAAERLERHGKEVSGEVRDLRSAEGQRAIRAAGTLGRSSGGDGGRAQMRAMSTGSTSGGSFVSPEWLQAMWAQYYTYPPSVMAQATPIQDPGHGMSINVPSFSGALTVGEQVSENSAVSDSAPGGAALTSNLATFAGEVEISQQLFDRSDVPGGFQFDEICHRELAGSLDTQLDSYVITQMLANAGSVSGASTLNAADLWGDVGKAKSALATSAGSLLPATGIFMTPPWAEYLLSASDPNGRPVLLPAPTGAVLPIRLSPQGGPPVGFTGDRLTGVALFGDGSIPTTDSGAETQFIVAHMPEVFVQQSEPVLRTIPETFASTLTVVVQLYCLVGVIVRHNSAVQIIAGSAYPASPSFA